MDGLLHSSPRSGLASRSLSDTVLLPLVMSVTHVGFPPACLCCVAVSTSAQMTRIMCVSCPESVGQGMCRTPPASLDANTRSRRVPPPPLPGVRVWAHGVQKCPVCARRPGAPMDASRCRGTRAHCACVGTLRLLFFPGKALFRAMMCVCGCVCSACTPGIFAPWSCCACLRRRLPSFLPFPPP
jgi:hypothetical protein